MNDVQAFYVAHVYQESTSSKMLYNWNSMYWASNVFLAQLTNEGAPTADPKPVMATARLNPKPCEAVPGMDPATARHLKLLQPDDCMWPPANLFSTEYEPLSRAGTFHERAQYFLKVWVCGFDSKVMKYTPLGGASNQNDPSTGSTQAR